MRSSARQSALETREERNGESGCGAANKAAHEEVGEERGKSGIKVSHVSVYC